MVTNLTFFYSGHFFILPVSAFGFFKLGGMAKAIPRNYLSFPPNPSHLPLLSIPTSPALGFLGKRRKLCFFLSLTSQCRQHMAQNCEAICSESGCILSSNSIKCFIWSFYGCNSLGTAQGERPGSSHLQCKPSSISLNGFSFVQQKRGNNLHFPLHTHA